MVQRPQVTQSQLSTVFWINAGFSIVLAVLFALSSPLLARLYHDTRVIPITITLSLLIVVTGFSQLQGALLNRQLRFVQIASFEVVASIVGAAVGIASALTGFGYWALVLNQVASSVTNAVLIWVFAKWRPSRPKRDPEVMSILRFGGHITGANLAGYLNTTIDNMMICLVIGQVGLGIYDRAWKLAVQPLMQLTAPIDRLALPILARLHADGDRYRNVYIQMLQLLCFVATPGLLFSVLMAKPVVLLLFGEKWHDMIPVFSWIGFGALISPLNMAAFWLLTSQGRGKQQMSLMVKATVINILAYASGLPWGLTGVARASAISVYLLQCPLIVWAATKEGPVNLALMLKAVYPFAIALGVTALIIKYITGLYLVSGFIVLAVGLTLTYAAVTPSSLALSPGDGS